MKSSTHKRKNIFSSPARARKDVFFLKSGSWRAPFYNQSRICKPPAETEQNQVIALDEAVKNGKLKEGDNLILFGFGGGLTYTGLIVKWGAPAS
ncbi:3-oxoacyl-(acyl-carrier-protein) synthase KASIII [Bacillus paralicheniformis]|nr:3-oxoacyl-(acyl-carrier-protein) synthase KASIII [Bacillus paralicheniformis]